MKKVFFGIGVLCFGLLMLASDCGMLPYPPISAGLARHLPQWSLDGSKIVFNYDAASIYTVASDGSSLTVVAKGKPYDEPKISPNISPDGTRVVYSQFVEPSFWGSGHPRWEIKVAGIDGSSKKTLAKHERSNLNPAWSPDGSRIAFVSDRAEGHEYNFYTMAADGSDVRIVAPSGTRPPVWLSDGKRIAIGSLLYSVEHGEEVLMANVEDNARVEVWAPLAWLPDGKRVAFRGLENEAFALYTANPDGSDLTKVTEIDRHLLVAREPRESLQWSPNGTQLLLSGSRNSVIVVNADGSDLRTWPNLGVVHASWSPDGARVAYSSWEPPRGRGEKPDKSAIRIVLATANPDWSDTRVLVIEREGKLYKAGQPK